MLTAKKLVPSLDLEDTPLVQRRAWLGLSPRAERPIDPCYPTPVRTSGANPDQGIGTGGPLPPPPALCPPDDVQTEGRGGGGGRGECGGTRPPPLPASLSILTPTLRNRGRRPRITSRRSHAIAPGRVPSGDPPRHPAPCRHN